ESFAFLQNAHSIQGHDSIRILVDCGGVVTCMHGFELALPEVLTSLESILEISRSTRALQPVGGSFRYQPAFCYERDRVGLQAAGHVGNRMLFSCELRDLPLVGFAFDFR